MQNPVDCEVLVLRDDHGSCFSTVRANLVVRGFSKPPIGYVLGTVSERFNSSCERRWELSVDEKAQSCAPEHRVIVLLGGELQNCRDVVGFEIRVVCQDLFARSSGGEEVEHVLDADAEAANARTAATDIRTHRDSVDRAHAGIVTRLTDEGQQYGL